MWRENQPLIVSACAIWHKLKGSATNADFAGCPDPIPLRDWRPGLVWGPRERLSGRRADLFHEKSIRIDVFPDSDV